jgi:predicted DNA-binding transcriptional regulator AlpA
MSKSIRRKSIPTIEQIRGTDLLDIDAVCVVVGGTRPVHRATVYRAVEAKRLPRPIFTTPNTARWLRSEVEAALEQAKAERTA